MEEAALRFRALMVSLVNGINPFTSLPPKIFDNIIARLDLQGLRVLRCCCKQLGVWTTPLLFGIIRVRFRLRDLTALRCIAASNTLREHVYTVLYVGDQNRSYHTFGLWKGAIGIPDTNPYHEDSADPIELDPGTLEHALWQGYRRYQQVRKEQSVSWPPELN